MNPLSWPLAVKIAAVAVLAAGAGGGAALAINSGQGQASPAPATAPAVSHHVAAATVQCGLTSCSHGTVGQPCTIASYPGIVVQSGPGTLACDPSPGNFPSAGSSAPPAPASAPDAGDCLLGANGADVQVGIANPTSSCAQWITALAGTGLAWYPISQMAAPGDAGSADSETMQAACDLTDGTQELYVEDAGSQDYGDSICSQEEQNGWTPEGSPGPLAVQAQQQVQASASAAVVQASAAASASQAAANAAAEQQAQSDLATVQGISFTSDLHSLAADVTQTNTDLATEKTDAAAGPNGPDGYCSNLDGTVDADVEGTIGADVEGSIGADLEGNLIPDIGTARSDISAARQDLSGLSSAGLPAPSGASAVITAAQQAISSAVSTANGDISQANSDVSQAYAVANGIATGSCEGDGPGSPPSPVAPVS